MNLGHFLCLPLFYTSNHFCWGQGCSREIGGFEKQKHVHAWRITFLPGKTDLFDIYNSPVMYCFELVAFYACYYWSTSFFSKSVPHHIPHFIFLFFYLSKMWATLIPKSKHIPFRPVVVIHESNGGDLCLLSKERTVGQRRLKSSPSPRPLWIAFPSTHHAYWG